MQRVTVILSSVFLALVVVTTALIEAADPPLIRLGTGFAGEEQLWLMTVRPDLTPNQGKKYRLKLVQFQGNVERFQAYLAGELDGGSAPGLAVIFARAQGVDLKIVASMMQEAAGKEWFSAASWGSSPPSTFTCGWVCSTRG